MKKSLLIAPALGVLVLAAAGSVGGTVAWFSANSTWTMDANNFAITKLDGNLEAEITEGTGTKKKADADVIYVAEDAANDSPNELTHASYDYASDKVFVSTGGTSYAVKTELLAKAKKDTVQPHNVYYAVTWTVTFHYTFPADTTPVNLYFDITDGTGSSATANTTPSGTLQTHKGFRLGIIGKEPTSGHGTTNKRVWAPLEDDADEAKKYVSWSTDKGVAANYTAESKVLITGHAANYGTGATDYNKTDVAQCLGQFTAIGANKKSDLEFKFIAWFEGEDKNIVDEAQLNSVKASLKFYTRQNNPQPVVQP